MSHAKGLRMCTQKALEHPGLPEEYKLISMDIVVMLLESSRASDPGRAVKLLEHTLKHHDNDPNRHTLLGDYLEKCNKHNRAMKHFNKAIQVHGIPSNAYSS